MNRRNLVLIFVFVIVLIIIALLFSTLPAMVHQKTEVLIDQKSGAVESLVFMLGNFTLVDKYFVNSEHPPIIHINLVIADETAVITWHIVKISMPEIKDLISSKVGFDKYIVKNGYGGNVISEDVTVNEKGDYVFVFLQSNDNISVQPYNSTISITYWVN